MLNLDSLQPIADNKKFNAVTTEDFIKVAAEPAKFSANTLDLQTPKQSSINTNTPSPDAIGTDVPPPDVAPLPEQPEPTPQAAEIDPQAAIDGVNRFIFLRDMVFACGFALWCKDIGLMHAFMLTEPQKKSLYAVYKNYAHLFIKTPKYLDLLLAELMILGATFKIANKIRKQNNTEIAETITENTTDTNPDNFIGNIEHEGRKYYQLEDNGTYKFKAMEYVREKNANKVKADFEKHYTQIVNANGIDKVNRILANI
jgi:hypothetical protein